MDIMDSQRASGLDWKQVEQDLYTSTIHGLASTEVVTRQNAYGLNEFDAGEETPLWRKYLDQVSGRLLIIIVI